MTNNRPTTLQEHAMRFGTVMGIYWIFKFIFLPMGFKIPFLHLLFVLLTLLVPVLGYIYARKYRMKYCNNEISFLRAFSFTLLMYMFASLLTAVAHYVYFRFFDQGFIIETYRTQLESIQSAGIQGLSDSIEPLMQTIDTIAALTPIQLTAQLISQNIFYGTILALFTALLVMRQKK